MTWPDLVAAQAAVSTGLGAPVRLRATTAPLPPGALFPGERSVRDQLGSVARRRDWCLGRAALRLLLDGADTSTVAFPHPHLSLTHAAGVAVAAGCDNGSVGLGIDFEGWRPIDPRAARFYLRSRERRAIGSADDLLRLWTVKEALYKATAGNATGGLLDYEVDDPSASGGTAWDRRGEVFCYVSGCLPEGRLTVAICTGVARAAV